MPLNSVSPIEKIISIFSYITMGIVGLIWIIIAYFLKQKLRYFLMYNIAQSMLISILYAIITLLIGTVLKIFSVIPFLKVFSAHLNYFFTIKIVSIFGLSYSIVQLLLSLLLLYIIIVILLGRIFYVPILSNLMNKAMKSYR